LGLAQLALKPQCRERTEHLGRYRFDRGATMCDRQLWRIMTASGTRNKYGLLLIGGSALIGAMAHRIMRMATYFRERFEFTDEVGFVTFYGGPRVAPWLKAYRGLHNLAHSRMQISEGDHFRRIIIRDVYAPKGIGMAVKDLWHYVNFCQVSRPPYDLAVFGYPGNAWLASLLKRSGQVKKLIYDDWDYHVGLETSWLGRRCVDSREQLCAQDADAVITVSSLLTDLRLKQRAKRVLVIPNGADFALFSQARRKVPHPPTLVYMGSISPLWKIDLAIRALPELVRAVPRVRLLIAGYGPAEDDLKALGRELGVAEHIEFLGRVEPCRLPRILAEADIGIATSSLGSTFRHYASPLKLTEYMAAGLPIIASRVGQTEITMTEAGAGYLIGESAQEFASAALRLLTDKEEYARCSQAGVGYAARFDWESLLDKAYHYSVCVLEGAETFPEEFRAQ